MKEIIRLFASLAFCCIFFMWVVNEAVYAVLPTNFIASNVFINSGSHSFEFDSNYNGNYSSLYVRDTATGNTIASVANGICEADSCVGTFTVWDGNADRVQICINDGSSTTCSQEIDWYIITNGIFKVSAFDKTTGTFTLSIAPIDVQQITLSRNGTLLKNSISNQLSVNSNTIKSNDFINYDLSGENLFFAYQTSSAWYLSSRFSVNNGSINTVTTSPATKTTTTTTTTITIIAPTPTPKIISDSTKPQVTITTDLTSPFDEAPKIEGKATDSGDVNPGISKIEYSIDDGKNWQDVDNIKSPNAKSTTFDFIPVIFEDGNYKVRVRVKDNAGNLTSSGVKTLIIDRLPPLVGGVLFSVGPLIISPEPSGFIFVLKGLEQKITLSAVGGATEIDIQSSAISLQTSDKTEKSLYSLVKNVDNGLWSGTLSFSEAGLYKLKAKSVDGAGNKTERMLNSVVVTEGGRVIDEKGVAIKDAKVTMYYYDLASQQFSVWDGSSFGEQNPQKVNEQGSYKLLVPPGKYYLQISSPGFKTQKTSIFSLNTSAPLNTSFTLQKAKGIKIGPFILYLPNFKQDEVVVDVNLPEESQEVSAPEKEALNKELPYFSFNMDDKVTTANDFKGKPTVLSFMSSWYPATFEQLTILNDLPKKEFNTGVIMEQETASRVSIFKKRGGYSLSILSDSDGILIEPLGILNLPTHAFLDRKGIVKKIKVGVLTKDELIGNLVN